MSEFKVGDLVTVNSRDGSFRARVVCMYPDDLGYDVRPLEGPYMHWNIGVKAEEIEPA